MNLPLFLWIMCRLLCRNEKKLGTSNLFFDKIIFNKIILQDLKDLFHYNTVTTVLNFFLENICLFVNNNIKMSNKHRMFPVRVF